MCTLSPRISEFLHISFSLSWWLHVYPLLILWLDSLPALLSPHVPPACPTSTDYETVTLTNTHVYIDVQVRLCIRGFVSNETKVVITRMFSDMFVSVCIWVSQTQSERLRESPSTEKEYFLYLEPYKSMFPASSCIYAGFSNTVKTFRHSVART